MGLHQNNGIQLMRTETGRKFYDEMTPKKFMKIETYQENSLKERAEMAQRLGDISLIVLDEIKLVLRLAKDILDKPGCTTKEKLDAGRLINSAAKTYNQLLYTMYRENKYLGVEVAKPLPKNSPPEFEASDD